MRSLRALRLPRLTRPSLSKLIKTNRFAWPIWPTDSARRWASRVEKFSHFDPDRLIKSRRFEQVSVASDASQRPTTSTDSTSSKTIQKYGDSSETSITSADRKCAMTSEAAVPVHISTMGDLDNLVYGPGTRKKILIISQDNCPGCKAIKSLISNLQQRWPDQVHTLNLTEFAKVNKKSSVQYLNKCFGFIIKQVPSAFLLFGNRNPMDPFWEFDEIDRLTFEQKVSTFLQV